MSDPQGQVKTIERFDIHDAAAVQNEVLNRLMVGDMKADQAKAILAIIDQRRKGAELIISARKGGLSFTADFLNGIGVNGVLALPASGEKAK